MSAIVKKDRRLKEQVLISINDDNMVPDINTELTTNKRTNEITSKQVFLWARRIKLQRVQKALIEATKDNKEFSDVMKACIAYLHLCEGSLLKYTVHIIWLQYYGNS